MTATGPGRVTVRAPRLDEAPDSAAVMDGLFLSLWHPPGFGGAGVSGQEPDR